jgi:hypothetical protein
MLGQKLLFVKPLSRNELNCHILAQKLDIMSIFFLDPLKSDDPPFHLGDQNSIYQRTSGICRGRA